MFLWPQCIYCRITQEQTWVTCQFITADHALLQGLKMNSTGLEEDIYDWFSMFPNLSVNKCRSRVVTKQCFTLKCIHCSKNTKSNATKQNSVPYRQSLRHTKGTQKSFQDISQTYISLNLTSKINPKPKSTLKRQILFIKDLLWYKIFSGPQSQKHTGAECNSWAKRAFVHDCRYWNNTKSLAQYCESELRGNNLVLIETAFFE